MKTRQAPCSVSMLAFLILLPPPVFPGDPLVTVTPDWGKVMCTSKTALSMEVCVEPPMRRNSPIHDQLFGALRDLHADYARYSPWYPYPKLAVAELESPREGRTSWDFSLLDPLLEDFMQATEGHPVVINISTIPQWMFRTDMPVAYPSDPNEITWTYEQGKELRDVSTRRVAEYFARLVSWYTKGGFQDEYGQWHGSGHHFKFDYWEVLNEVDFEHRMTPQFYTALYDAIVAEIRQAAPEMKFVGLALAQPMKAAEFFRYFLNHKNHKLDIPLDVISYHFYAVPAPDESVEMMQHTFFTQADGFIDGVGYIESIRKSLSPETQTHVNEIGTILPEARAPRLVNPIPNSYWNLSGALFAYVYGHLARLSINVAHESELIDYPGQFPGTNLVDWDSGRANARYWVLKLLRDHFGSGDKLVDTRVTMPEIDPELASPYVFAQAFITGQGIYKILLVNKRDRVFRVSIPGGGSSHVDFVDQTTAFNPPAAGRLKEGELNLSGFAVAVVCLAK